MRTLLISSVVLVLNGCAIFSPYDSKFMCQQTDDYGRCIGVEGAYDEALSGDSFIQPNSQIAHEKQQATPHQQTALSKERMSYKEAEYREMRALIEDPVTPLVKPPKVLKTLVVAYPSGSKTLYSPRYIWYIANEGQFVVGDYLNAPHGGQRPALTPFGSE